MDKNTCMTGRKDFVTNEVNMCVTYPFMSPPFDNLIIKEDKGSVGKCWVFFLNNVGVLKGLLLPSNYRIFDIKKLISGNGIFF